MFLNTRVSGSGILELRGCGLIGLSSENSFGSIGFYIWTLWAISEFNGVRVKRFLEHYGFRFLDV